MLSVRLNRKPASDNYASIVNGFWNELPSVFKHDFNEWQGKMSVPVNVKETDNGYELEVVAPGFDKKDFNISVDQQLLTISGERKSEVKEENPGKETEARKGDKILRREYSYQSFKRTFTLDDKIDATRIEASYINGVLNLNLPWKDEVKAPAKAIEIK
jgi:HSP20 family protein